jgi:pimeloyl-ACP methyl ester carboxylesterase
MAYFKHGNLRTYYEDLGSGEPIIANHGLSEDVGYWGDTGITARLIKKYRFIPYEMRGHGRTVVQGEPYGYDVDTMIGDINALADHLGLQKFHLLSHATGGMLAARYGMKHSDRLLSLMLTDAGPATRTPIPPPYAVNLTEEERRKLNEEALKHIDDKTTREERKARWLQNPGPFTFTIAARPEPERDRMFESMNGFYNRRLSQRAMFDFRNSFYSDPDPRVAELRGIKCPTLVLLGEHDVVFLEPSKLMAREIPNSKLVVIPDVGHMTAIEAPERTADEILAFLDTVKKTGKAS